jgi:hypothetical protein
MEIIAFQHRTWTGFIAANLSECNGSTVNVDGDTITNGMWSH